MWLLTFTSFLRKMLCSFKNDGLEIASFDPCSWLLLPARVTYSLIAANGSRFSTSSRVEREKKAIKLR